MFGVCANSYAQDDAKVVSLDHGCGGHSEVIADTKSVPVGTTVVNEEGFFDATEIDEDSIEEEIDLADADLQEVDEFAHDGEEVDDDDDDEDDEAAEDAEANRLDVLDEVLNNNEEN
jgi:hypothetical protein